MKASPATSISRRSRKRSLAYRTGRSVGRPPIDQPPTPTQDSLKAYAPEKDSVSITNAMSQMGERIAGQQRKSPATPLNSHQPARALKSSSAERYNDAGMLAAPASTPATASVPFTTPPFQPSRTPARRSRSNPRRCNAADRLYQADWLFRYYGFGVEEIASGGEGGMLDLDIDPQLALERSRTRDRFPVGDQHGRSRSASAHPRARRPRHRPHHYRSPPHISLRLEDVGCVCAGLKRVRPFIITAD